MEPSSYVKKNKCCNRNDRDKKVKASSQDHDKWLIMVNEMSGKSVIDKNSFDGKKIKITKKWTKGRCFEKIDGKSDNSPHVSCQKVKQIFCLSRAFCQEKDKNWNDKNNPEVLFCNKNKKSTNARKIKKPRLSCL